jgi:O-antigen/teichoic acid export membrane protein
MISARLHGFLIRLPAVTAPRWRSAIRQGGVIFAGYAAIALVGMGALRLYTELAPKAVFGEANLLLTALMLGMQIFVAPFTNTQLRYHTEAASHGQADVFTHEALVWALRGAAALGVLALIGCLIWGKMGRVTLGPEVALAALAWALAFSVRNVLMSRLQAEQRRMSYTALMVIEALAQAGLTIVALHIAATTGAFVLGQVFAAVTLIALIMRLARWPILKRRAAQVGSPGFLARAASYGPAFVPLALVGWLANLADRYSLALLLGAAAVGEYVAPLSIASRMMTMANGALNDLFRPTLFDAENRRDHARANQVFAVWLVISALVGAALVAAIILAGHLVIGLLLGRAYRSHAESIMIWVASGYAVYGLTQILETRMLSVGKSAWLIIPMAAGAVANVAFSILLIARHGITGAAQANCLSFLVQCMVTSVFLATALRRHARD